MDGEKLTIAEAEQTFIDDLRELGDWFLEYEYLLRLSADLPRIPAERRTEENRVPGCQSGVWLELAEDGGRVRVLADSEALIIRGILAIAVDLLDGRTAQEVAAYVPRYFDETDIRHQLTTDRFRGLNAVIGAIRDFARKMLI